MRACPLPSYPISGARLNSILVSRFLLDLQETSAHALQSDTMTEVPVASSLHFNGIIGSLGNVITSTQSEEEPDSNWAQKDVDDVEIAMHVDTPGDSIVSRL